jgi:hypothetical protein
MPVLPRATYTVPVAARGSLNGSTAIRDVSGRVVGLNEVMLETFAARVALYEDLDLRVGARTRFFGAAALVNSALLELCSRHRLVRVACAPGIDFLARLGGYLQVFNIAMAEGIARGRWRGSWSDVTLVTLEQAAVEALLQRLARWDGRAHRRVVRRLDRLLYCLAWVRGLSGCGPNIELLSHGVRIAQCAQGRDISFASMRYRAAVGYSLIGLLRNSQPRSAGDNRSAPFARRMPSEGVAESLS